MNRLSKPVLESAFIATLAALFALPAAADLEASRCVVSRGSHIDVLTSTYSNSCFGHVDRDAKGIFQRSVVLPEPMSGEVRASKDLRVIVYVANYLPLLKQEAIERNPVVVRAYREGALVQERRLNDIATADDLDESTSHVRFAKEVGDAVIDSKLVLVMNGGKRVTIDVAAR